MKKTKTGTINNFNQLGFEIIPYKKPFLVKNTNQITNNQKGECVFIQFIISKEYLKCKINALVIWPLTLSDLDNNVRIPFVKEISEFIPREKRYHIGNGGYICYAHIKQIRDENWIMNQNKFIEAIDEYFKCAVRTLKSGKNNFNGLPHHDTYAQMVLGFRKNQDNNI